MQNLKNSVIKTFKTLDPRILSLEEPILATESTAAKSFDGNGLTFYLKFLGAFKRDNDDESSSQAQDEASRREICSRLLCALKESKKKNKPGVALNISFGGLRVIDYMEGPNCLAASMAWSDLVSMEVDEECDRTLGLMGKTLGSSGLTVLGFKTYFESTFKARVIKEQITLLLRHLQWVWERARLEEQKRLRQRKKAHDKKVKDDNQKNEQTEQKMLKRKDEETDPKAAVKSQKKEKRSKPQAESSPQSSPQPKPQPQPQQSPEPQPEPAVGNLISLEEEEAPAVAADPRSRNLDALLLDLMEVKPPKVQAKSVKRPGTKAAAKKSRKPLPPLPSPIEEVPPPQPETAQAAPAPAHHGGARPKVFAVKRDAVQPAGTDPDDLPPPRQRSRTRRRLSLESEYELKKYFGGECQIDPIPQSSDRSNPDTPSTIYYEIIHPRNEGRLVDVEPVSRRQAPRHSSPKPSYPRADPFGTIENIQTACPPVQTVNTVRPTECTELEDEECTEPEDEEVPPPIPPKKYLSAAGASAQPASADLALLDFSLPVSAAPPRGGVPTPFVAALTSDPISVLALVPAAPRGAALLDLSLPMSAAPLRGGVPTPFVAALTLDPISVLSPLPAAPRGAAALPQPGATLPTASAAAAPPVQASTDTGRILPPPSNPFDDLMSGGVAMLKKELAGKPKTSARPPPPPPAATALPPPRAN